MSEHDPTQHDPAEPDLGGAAPTEPVPDASTGSPGQQPPATAPQLFGEPGVQPQGGYPSGSQGGSHGAYPAAAQGSSSSGWTSRTDDLDAAMAPPPAGRRVPLPTAILAAAVVAAIAFGGGVLVQRHSGGSSSVSAQRPGGFGAGRFGGEGGFGQRQIPGQGGGQGEGQGGGQGRGFGAPVTGTVVSASGTTLTVKQSDGTEVKVTVPSSVPVVTSTTGSLSSLKTGSEVTVIGEKGSDGTVTARAVTSGTGLGRLFGGFRPGSAATGATSAQAG